MVAGSALSRLVWQAEKGRTFRIFGRCRPRSDEPLCNYIVPLSPGGGKMVGSTDVAEVTWAVPTTKALAATHGIGTPVHGRQITAQGKSPAAPKGKTHAAKTEARWDEMLFGDKSLLAAAKTGHAGRLAATPCVCPLPAGLKPPVMPRPAP